MLIDQTEPAAPTDPNLAFIDCQKKLAAAVTSIRNLTDGPLGETKPEPLERGLAFSALTEVEDQLLAVFTNLREAQPHKATVLR